MQQLMKNNCLRIPDFATYTNSVIYLGNLFTFIPNKFHMRTLKISVSFFMLLFAASTSFCQRVDSILNVLAVQYPAEKVFIHYDKDAYVAGETFWFKSYRTRDGVPSGMSTDFYVQLTGEKGNVVTSKTYPVLGATVTCNIGLPDSLPQRNYYIKAATPAMLNYGSNFIYTRNIYVYGI